MSKKLPKIIVIVGPTASGKSELAVRLAQRFNGEIISADSRQVYKGLNVGTAKVPGTWKKVGNKPVFVYKGIPHHCIDFVSVKRVYTAAEFREKARRIIPDIIKRGSVPIIAGGTGFWIDALVYGQELPDVPPNPVLRKKLAGKSVSELAEILRSLDAGRVQTIDTKNPRRLLRAIEIASALGNVPKTSKKRPYNALWIGLNSDPETRKEKIRQRSQKLMRGLLPETRMLARNIPRVRIRELGFEYAATLHYLDGAITKKQLHDQLIQDTLRYAKRQMTWFKRNHDIKWIKHSGKGEMLAKNFLSSPT